MTFKLHTIQIKSKPVNSRLAGELETVFFCLGCTENQINLQSLLWKQSSKTIIRLDLNKLQNERQTKNKQTHKWLDFSITVVTPLNECERKFR